MIANIGPIASRDSFLLAISVSVIAFSLWPAEKPRQQISWDRGNGQIQTFSLTIDDPRLPELRRNLSSPHEKPMVLATGLPSRQLALAKWRKETADFYARQLAGSVPEVAQVSFDAAVGPLLQKQGSESTLTPAHRDYWLKVSEDATAVIAAEVIAAQVIAVQRQGPLADPSQRVSPSAGSLPIQFGTVTTPPRSGFSLIFCVVLGMGTAIAFAAWTRVCPSIRLTGEEDIDPDHSPSCLGNLSRSGNGLRMEIPSEWVRIHQPIGVLSRHAVYGSVVIWAIFCCLH